MAIEKYSTEGILVQSYENAESDVVFKIYTRDYGMIFARQVSLKKSVKLRQHLQVGRVSVVTLVKGKDQYRLAGATEVYIAGNFLHYIVGLLGRFITGEAKNLKLYDRLIEYSKLDSNQYDLQDLRLCVMSDILIQGGYIDTNMIGLSLEDYKNNDTLYYYTHVILNKKQIILQVNKAIKESML